MSIDTEQLQLYSPVDRPPLTERANFLPPNTLQMGSEAYASPHARQIIANNIDGLRRNDDGITLVRKLGEVSWNLKVVGAVAMGSQFVTATIAETLSAVTIPGTVGATIATGSIGLSLLVQDYRRDVATERSIGAKALPEMSEVLNFWVVESERGRRDVVTCWSGAKKPAENEKTPELHSSLKLVASLAKENNVSAVFVPPHILEAVPAAETIGKKIDLQDWRHVGRKLILMHRRTMAV
jgi:hypothetical protein